MTTKLKIIQPRVVVKNATVRNVVKFPISLPGAKGDQGDQGEKGWSPMLAIVYDDERRVLRVADWAGGEGEKPATGQYIGISGFVSNISDGVDVRGPAGSGGGADLSGLPEYTDDESAIADGLSVGDFYIIADGSDVGASGLLKKVRSI